MTPTLKDFVQQMSKSFQGIPLAAWRPLMSQRQDFLNSHLARVPVTPSEQGTHEMRDEVLSSVGAQEMETCGFHVFDKDDVVFFFGIFINWM